MQSMEEMLKAAQEAAQTIQQQMNEAQVKLDSIEVEGVSGGGLVKIRCTAKGRILSVSIDDSLFVGAGSGDGGDKTMLEDLVTAAFNDARHKADQAAGAEMQRIQSGMGLPPGLNIPGLG
jgi:DNA-binding YbaB/EbfC family protein